MEIIMNNQENKNKGNFKKHPYYKKKNKHKNHKKPTDAAQGEIAVSNNPQTIKKKFLWEDP